MYCKMESNNKLKEIDIKSCTCYYFNDKIKFEDFDPDNILMDEKSHESTLASNISYKSLIDSKPLPLSSIKKMDLLEFKMELDI